MVERPGQTLEFFLRSEGHTNKYVARRNKLSINYDPAMIEGHRDRHARPQEDADEEAEEVVGEEERVLF
jgi:hypothetical protein